MSITIAPSDNSAIPSAFSEPAVSRAVGQVNGNISQSGGIQKTATSAENLSVWQGMVAPAPNATGSSLEESPVVGILPWLVRRSRSSTASGNFPATGMAGFPLIYLASSTILEVRGKSRALVSYSFTFSSHDAGDRLAGHRQPAKTGQRC